MEKLRGSGDAPGNVTEAFQYTMLCLLVLMCFGERLDEAAVRAVEHAERAWLAHISSPRQMGTGGEAPRRDRGRVRGRRGLGLGGGRQLASGADCREGEFGEQAISDVFMIGKR